MPYSISPRDEDRILKKQNHYRILEKQNWRFCFSGILVRYGDGSLRHSACARYLGPCQPRKLSISHNFFCLGREVPASHFDNVASPTPISCAIRLTLSPEAATKSLRALKSGCSLLVAVSIDAFCRSCRASTTSLPSIRDLCERDWI